jgi:hypothetical protein
MHMCARHHQRIHRIEGLRRDNLNIMRQYQIQQTNQSDYKDFTKTAALPHLQQLLRILARNGGLLTIGWERWATCSNALAAMPERINNNQRHHCVRTRKGMTLPHASHSGKNSPGRLRSTNAAAPALSAHAVVEVANT